MKAKRVAAGLLACLMLLTMAGCGGDSSETEAAAQQEQDMGTAVETQTVTRTDLSNENMVSGQIIADTSVSVVPTIGGTVKSLPVKAGDTVQKGQLLFQIDTSQITSSYGALQESYSATQQMTNEAIQNAQDALPLFHNGNGGASYVLQERDVYRIGFGTSPNFFTCRERFAPFRMHAV